MKTPSIGDFHTDLVAVGSRVTCSPPPEGTDQDWLAMIPPAKWDAFALHMIGDGGWTVGGSLIPNDANYLPSEQRFNSFTLGEDNVIATSDEQFFSRFMAASSVAKRLNLLDKADRIALFQAVLYAKQDGVVSNELPF